MSKPRPPARNVLVPGKAYLEARQVMAVRKRQWDQWIADCKDG